MKHLTMRWVQGSNLLELALTSFQDSRITVLPTLPNCARLRSALLNFGEAKAEEAGLEPASAYARSISNAVP